MKNTKPTLTIGIPAYNEEGNIKNLLVSISNQSRVCYLLNKIIIVADGCTDNTVDIAKSISIKGVNIEILSKGNRKGKAFALNTIYSKADTDLLLTIDADLVFKNINAIDELVNRIIKNPQLMLVGPRHIPVKSKTLMGKFAYISYLSLEDAFIKLNNGNNFYAMMGAGLIRKKIYKSFIYPKGTISDQCYLYAVSTKNNHDAFELVKSSQVYFRVVESFNDWRILGVRSVIADKKDITKRFGKDVLKRYSLTKKLIIKSLFKYFILHPVPTIGSVLMNLYIRLFPYKRAAPKNGMWQIATSSKIGIITALTQSL